MNESTLNEGRDSTINKSTLNESTVNESTLHKGPVNESTLHESTTVNEDPVNESTLHEGTVIARTDLEPQNQNREQAQLQHQLAPGSMQLVRFAD